MRETVGAQRVLCLQVLSLERWQVNCWRISFLNWAIRHLSAGIPVRISA